MHGSELRLFMGQGIPPTITLQVQCRTERVGTIFKVFGMTWIQLRRLKLASFPSSSGHFYFDACGHEQLMRRFRDRAGNCD